MRESELPLNILQVIPELDAGGAERTAIDVAKAVIDDGGKAVIASQGGRLEHELLNHGGRLERLALASKNPLTIRRNIAPLVNIIQSQNIHLVHARSRAPAWSAYYAAKQCKVPFIATYHGTYSSGNPLKRAYNRIMTRGPKVIANSEFIAEHIQTEHHIPQDRIVTIPRGSDLSAFDPTGVPQDDQNALRAQWNLNNDSRPIIFLPGRLTRWKGQSVLVKAAALLRQQRCENFVCILAGDAQGRDGYVDELQRLIDEHSLNHHIYIVGHCSEMPAAYALSTLVISASTKPEAFGRIAVEAQAMKKPVIVSDHGGSRETVLDGATGWRVPPNDPQALAQAIHHCLQLSPEAQEEIGLKGRNHVLNAYSVNQMCAKTLAVYRDVLKDHQGGK